MNTTLSEICENLFPEIYREINWRDLWERPLANGAGFQWTILFSAVNSFIQHGWSCDVPLFKLPNGRDFFLLRNEIPQQFGSQAGHSAAPLTDVPLKDIFVQSLIPKFVLSKNGINLSIFYEGCPYHRIMKGVEYAIRPDILFFPGSIIEIPTLNVDSTELSYKYSYNDHLALEGTMRIGNFRILPVIKRAPAENIDLPVQGVVECTVNKSEAVALAQLVAYKNIFTPIKSETAILVSGNKSQLEPSVFVDLEGTPAQIVASIKIAGDFIYESFSP